MIEKRKIWLPLEQSTELYAGQRIGFQRGPANGDISFLGCVVRINTVPVPKTHVLIDIGSGEISAYNRSGVMAEFEYAADDVVRS